MRNFAPGRNPNWRKADLPPREPTASAAPATPTAIAPAVPAHSIAGMSDRPAFEDHRRDGETSQERLPPSIALRAVDQQARGRQPAPARIQSNAAILSPAST